MRDYSRSVVVMHDDPPLVRRDAIAARFRGGRSVVAVTRAAAGLTAGAAGR
jgi:hypothetical protein